MIYRTSRFSNKKINYIKLSLKLIWGKNGYFFIDNSNIEIRDLEDDIYLLQSGKTLIFK